jgi:hypothetical protein
MNHELHFFYLFDQASLLKRGFPQLSLRNSVQFVFEPLDNFSGFRQ